MAALGPIVQRAARPRGRRWRCEFSNGRPTSWRSPPGAVAVPPRDARRRVRILSWRAASSASCRGSRPSCRGGSSRSRPGAVRVARGRAGRSARYGWRSRRHEAAHVCLATKPRSDDARPRLCRDPETPRSRAGAATSPAARREPAAACSGCRPGRTPMPLYRELVARCIGPAASISRAPRPSTSTSSSASPATIRAAIAALHAAGTSSTT